MFPSAESSINRKKTLIFLIIAAIIAFIVRVLAVLYFNYYDEIIHEYMDIADTMLQGKGYSWGRWMTIPPQPTAVFPPLYVYFLLIPMMLSKSNYLLVYIVQSIVAATGVIPAYLVGKKMFSYKVGLICAMFYAIFPEMVALPVRPIAEFAIVVMSLWLIYFYLGLKDSLSVGKNIVIKSFLIGIFTGAMMLTKVSSIIIISSIALALILSHKAYFKTIKLAVIPLIAGIVLVMSPWVIRNYIVFDKFIPLRIGSGYNLWVGNNPYTFGTTRGMDGRHINFTFSQEYYSSIYDNFPQDEIEWDKFLRRKGKEYIKENPKRYLKLCLNRLFYFIWIDPTHPLSKHPAYFTGYIVLLVLGVPGLIMLFVKKRIDPALIFIIILNIIVYIPTIYLPRYRVLTIMVLMLVSAYSIEKLLSFLTKRLK